MKTEPKPPFGLGHVMEAQTRSPFGLGHVMETQTHSPFGLGLVMETQTHFPFGLGLIMKTEIQSPVGLKDLIDDLQHHQSEAKQKTSNRQENTKNGLQKKGNCSAPWMARASIKAWPGAPIARPSNAVDNLQPGAARVSG